MLWRRAEGGYATAQNGRAGYVTPAAYEAMRRSVSAIADSRTLVFGIADVKRDESPMVSRAQLEEAAALGRKLARLRLARRMRQADAAARAGMSRSTASLIESGDIRRTLAQLLRYLEAVAPGLTLEALIKEEDPALLVLKSREARQRVRPLSDKELKELDF